MSDQPIEKASTYAGQHNTETLRLHASREIRTHDRSNQAAKNHALDRAATETGN
jgi:hypothetical protein